MARRKFSVAREKDFKGITAGAAPSKIPPGFYQSDENGNSGIPYEGAWTPRHGYSRMCRFGHGSVLNTGAEVNGLFLYTPAVSAESIHHYSDDISVYSRNLLVTSGGTLYGFDLVRPREAWRSAP